MINISRPRKIEEIENNNTCNKIKISNLIFQKLIYFVQTSNKKIPRTTRRTFQQVFNKKIA